MRIHLGRSDIRGRCGSRDATESILLVVDRDRLVASIIGNADITKTSLTASTSWAALGYHFGDRRIQNR
jgi:hypothetical protein